MLEADGPADATVTRHIDRCLSCLSCMTTCPAGVDYMHLVDHARGHIERTWKRPLPERALRTLLSVVLPRPGLARLALLAARGPALLAPLFGGRLRALLRLAGRPAHGPSWVERPQVIPARGPRRKRVALLTGCVQCVLAPEINEAAARLLTRQGCEVVVAHGAGCCGALSHHLGDEARGLAQAGRTAAALAREAATGGLDAVVATASGCGTMLKDYGHLLKDDEACAADAALIAGLARDISEVLDELGLDCTGAPPTTAPVAYHSACSLQHGQRIEQQPMALLRAAGFTVRDGSGRASLLWFGRHLQYAAAGARRCARCAQGGGDRGYRCPAGSCGKHRLHGTDRRPHRAAGGAYCGVARLGDRRAAAAGAPQARRRMTRRPRGPTPIGSPAAGQDVMDIATERMDGVVSVLVDGRIDGSTVFAFQEAIETAIEDGDRAVIVDCERLSYIGSAGLRTVLAIAKAVSNRDARFALCSLSDQVRNVFEQSGFDTIIEIHRSRAESLASFGH